MFERSVLAAFAVILITAAAGQPACDAAVYCDDSVLSIVQPLRFWNDSKTFVDMPMKEDPAEVVAALRALGPSPSREDVGEWIGRYFDAAGSDVLSWVPHDWNAAPPALGRITDATFREWALQLNAIWKDLGKEISPNARAHPERHSLLLAPNPWIAPGGRFREFYNWDSFWIIAGLLHSGMHNTTRMMLENLLWTVGELGFTPNGARVYYSRRSQPPMLTLAVRRYMDATGDTEFLAKALTPLDQAYDWWMTNSSVVVAGHVLNRYIAGSSVPRPEGWVEDTRVASKVPDASSRAELFRNLATAAETGWDFSSRWLRDTNSSALNGTIASRVIPVDLNSILFAVELTLSDFHKAMGNFSKSEQYLSAATARAKAIQALLWNDKCTMWTDCVLSGEQSSPRCDRRDCSFFPSNIMPLWSGAYKLGNVDPEAVIKALVNVGALSFPGGVPTSRTEPETGMQWDWPLAWPPLQWFVVESLKAAGHTERARQLATRWVHSNYDAWKTFGQKMFEKYDCREEGMPGDSGEYDVQLGFGWTNGVVLDFLVQYFSA